MRLHSHRVMRLTLLATALLATIPLARAEGHTSAHSKRLFGPIHRAVLKVAPPPEEWRFQRGLLESDLHDFACEYELLDGDSTAALRTLLNRTEFADDNAPAPEFGVLIGIYLKAIDGTVTTLLLGQSVEDGSARGTIDGRRVVASRPFERDLRKLVAAMVPNTVRYTCEGSRSSTMSTEARFVRPARPQ